MEEEAMGKICGCWCKQESGKKRGKIDSFLQRVLQTQQAKKNNEGKISPLTEKLSALNRCN